MDPRTRRVACGARFLLVLLAALALGGCSHGLQRPRFSRPSDTVTPATPAVRRLRAGAADANLVIILVDAARADHLSAFGYERRTTPNLDRVFGGGCLFTEAYTTAPMTKSAVASLFTAQFPDTHGVIGRSTGLGPEAATLAERMRAAGYATAGFSANPFLSASFGFSRGFDSFSEVFRKVDIGPQGVGRVDGALLVEAAVEWLRLHGKERFFVYLHFLEPHFPYTPPRAFREEFRDLHAGRGSGEVSDYDANLAYVDALTGRLCKEMDRLGLLDRSVVVLLADHGEAFGEHGVSRHGAQVYQEMVHIPVAFRLPARCGAPRQRRAEVLTITDIMPTLLDLFQVPPPETMQGRSRLRLLAGEQEAEPGFTVSRAHGGDMSGGVDHPEQVSYGLRAEGYTLVLGTRGRQVELYQRATDPTERENVASQQPRVVKRLRGQFSTWAAGQRARPPVLRGGIVLTSGTKRVVLDEKTRQHLRALGYVK